MIVASGVELFECWTETLLSGRFVIGLSSPLPAGRPRDDDHPMFHTLSDGGSGHTFADVAIAEDFPISHGFSMSSDTFDGR
jgi:hypothetical protein